MTLSSALTSVGKSFPYYPKLCPVVGGVKACIFLCVIFWRGFEDTKGWVTLTMEDIEKESGLSEKEQRSARTTLKEIGVLQEKEDRIAHKLSYRIDIEALELSFDIDQETKRIEAPAQKEFPETPKGQFGNCPKGSSVISKYPDITSEGVGFSKVQHKSPPMLRVGRLFQRRDESRWSIKELKAFRAIGVISEDDLACLERYYLFNHPSDADYRRRDMPTLLNNWQGEVDRARKFKPAKQNTGY